MAQPPKSRSATALAAIEIETEFVPIATQGDRDRTSSLRVIGGQGVFVRAVESALLGGEIAVCDAILMEVLAGARDERHLHDLRRLLARAAVLPMDPRHYEEAAALFRLCRREGETVRKLIDCLIGAVAIHADAPVLHADGDFDVLARHTGLKIAEGSQGGAGAD